MDKRPYITLITGGARSGKSSHALSLAGPFARKAYIATAEALDPEMNERIAKHKAERGPLWHTAEVPLDVALWLDEHSAKYDAVVLDCLTLWLSNVMLGRHDIHAHAKGLLDALGRTSSRMIIVTNEVGMGLVPDTALGREFRDRAGWLNQSVAALADEVLLVVSGQSLKIKGG